MNVKWNSPSPGRAPVCDNCYHRNCGQPLGIDWIGGGVKRECCVCLCHAERSEPAALDMVAAAEERVAYLERQMSNYRYPDEREPKPKLSRWKRFLRWLKREA